MIWNKLKQKCSMGFIIGVVLAALHLCLVIVAYVAYVKSRSSTAGLVFVWFFVLDAPVHLLPSSAFDLFGTPTPLILYGIFGSAMWFLIPWLLDKGVKGLFPKINKLLRIIIIVALIPLILFGFSKLSRITIKRKIQAQRPDELKKVLNQASSEFLTHSVVYESDVSAGIISAYCMDIPGNPGKEIIAAMVDSLVFLDETFHEIRRLHLNGLRFIELEPLYLDEKGTYGFMGVRLSEGIWLLDSSGQEKWSYTHKNEYGMHPDGATHGDTDGDKEPEFVVYYRYREGIHLLDSDGSVQWKHPVNALGHVEVADLDRDGYDEIIYTHSNNANGKTTFTILDATGTVVKQMDIGTNSYEFEVVKWPEKNSDLCILLTEENIIRIIDLQGQRVMSFDAPGCRRFGVVQAADVTFNSDAPSYLVVKKNLHPDLMVLYVFSRDGTLVYQKTSVMDMGRSGDFAVVLFGDSGDEGLVVGLIRTMKPVLIEYSLSR